MRQKVLIAEDDRDLQLGLVDLLEGEGYEVTAVDNGQQALNSYHDSAFDLLLLDVMMPEKSGYDVCREIRRHDPDTPIIMLTAKGEEIDKVVGLQLGADDYVTKPFGLHELRARIAAVLRRSRKSAPRSAELPPSYSLGGAEIDRRGYALRRDGQSFKLSARELKLLDLFFARRGEVLSRDDLLNAAWGIDYCGTTRTLDQHIAQLRKKIETDPSAPQVILTVHGIGYRSP